MHISVLYRFWGHPEIENQYNVMLSFVPRQGDLVAFHDKMCGKDTWKVHELMWRADGGSVVIMLK